ncbi:D-2-hydroxyacid dehydrogenase family protein [Aeromonas sobria]|uniref:D-2-hydroxyacid dehydrogenase family protein n=1 Tax=Aeromonas sobria TaxID=646 RepID=UPI00111A32F8|nr:D-2-hydroxyacid dehydrogenase family protein [Aeromonas sobria]TNI85519.1 3-phosphoglycerate dehydrogenase [Aeromonas sobria]
MRIAILDDYQDQVRHLPCFALLAGHDVTILNQSEPDTARLAAMLEGMEALVLIRERTRIDEQLLMRLPSLKLISQTGKVSQHIDPTLCQRYSVAVAEGIGSPIAPAELCWALIMAASRHIPAYSQALSQGQWQQSGHLGLGRTLHGLTLGIWGYGKIGQRIARYGKAFGMSVLIWGSDASRRQAELDGYASASSKETFFSQADILTLHLRLSEATRGSVTRADLTRMKRNSLLVNTSRAELIEPGALYAELSTHPEKRAALDVFDTEPATPQNEPLLRLPNVLATPHLGYVEQNSYELYFRVAFENVLAFAAGQPRNLLKPT